MGAWRIWLPIVATLALVAGVYAYGSKRYDEGVEHQKAEYAKTVATQTRDLSSNLVVEQKKALEVLKNELTIAKTDAVAARDRQIKTTRDLESLRHVKETNCTNLDIDTLRLFNDGACNYNRKHGLSYGNAGGYQCPEADTPRP